MADLVLALFRSLISLTRPRVWLMLLAPAAISLLLWLGLACWGRDGLYNLLMACPPMPQLVAWEVRWLAQALAFLGSWMLIFACVYFTTAFLAAILVMPWLLDHVAEHDYPDVAGMGADSFWAAMGNSLIATLLFVIAWLISIPLWLIPGLALILPVLLMAWYNRRTFAYDALSLHATPEEWKKIRSEYRRGLFLIGLLMAMLAHVPVLGLLVPTLTALTYIHYCLEMLRRQRGGALVTAESRVVSEPAHSDV